MRFCALLRFGALHGPTMHLPHLRLLLCVKRDLRIPRVLFLFLHIWSPLCFFKHFSVDARRIPMLCSYPSWIIAWLASAGPNASGTDWLSFQEQTNQCRAFYFFGRVRGRLCVAPSSFLFIIDPSKMCLELHQPIGHVKFAGKVFRPRMETISDYQGRTVTKILRILCHRFRRK
jgi:hypothetical protein